MYMVESQINNCKEGVGQMGPIFSSPSEKGLIFYYLKRDILHVWKDDFNEKEIIVFIFFQIERITMSRPSKVF